MAKAAAIVVSNRMQRLAAGLLCIMAAHLVLASCTPEHTPFPATARVAITR